MWWFRNPDVALHLLGWEDRDVIQVDLLSPLSNGCPPGLSLQALTSLPEEHVLVTVLRAQELYEDTAACRTLHERGEGQGPGGHLSQAQPATDANTNTHMLSPATQ